MKATVDEVVLSRLKSLVSYLERQNGIDAGAIRVTLEHIILILESDTGGQEPDPFMLLEGPLL